MLIANALPGASYAAGVFSIPWTAISSATTNDVASAVDSYEKFLFGLLMAHYERQNSGAITQVNCAIEIANVSISSGSFETATNVFSDVTLHNFLVSASLGTSTAPLLTDVDQVQSV